MSTEPTTIEGAPGAPPDAPEAPTEPDYKAPELDIEEPGDELSEDNGSLGPREEDEQEIIEPKLDPVPRVLRDERGQERAYMQQGFLYFQQMEMYGLLGRATKIVLEGDGGLNMDDMFKMLDPRAMMDEMLSRQPGSDDAPQLGEGGDEANFADAARMLSAFSKLLEQTPVILREAYCIILNVPAGHREWAMNWSLPQLTREEGQDIMDTFIDQNWGVLYGFFTDELPRIVKRAAKAHQRFRESSGRRLGR